MVTRHDEIKLLLLQEGSFLLARFPSFRRSHAGRSSQQQFYPVVDPAATATKTRVTSYAQGDNSGKKDFLVEFKVYFIE